MATIFASIDIESSGGDFAWVDIVCGLRIAGGDFDRTNLKYGRYYFGQPYSMPWAYQDAELGDLGGATAIVLTVMALGPGGVAASLHLATTLNTDPAGGMAALDQIENALQILATSAVLQVDLSGSVEEGVAMTNLDGMETYPGEPIWVEMMGQGATGTAGPDTVLGAALAHVNYDSEAWPDRTISFRHAPVGDPASVWLRIRRISKTDSFPLPNVNPTQFPTFVPGPWQINTTRPVGSDIGLSTTLALSRFTELLPAASLNLDDSDIPTGWVLVHDIDYDFRDGYLQMRGDLSATTPAADEFKLFPLGKVEAEIRLEPIESQNAPFNGDFGGLIGVDIDVSYDDAPGSDLEDYVPGNNLFEMAVAEAIRERISGMVEQQVQDEVGPRILNTVVEQIDAQRPDNLFSDQDWQNLRDQIAAMFFLRFTELKFFEDGQIDGVPVVGGLRLDALAGSFSDQLVILGIAQSCPGIGAAQGFGGFAAFSMMYSMRKAVRSDERASGWNDKYRKHRKELFKIATSDREIAASVVRTVTAAAGVFMHRRRPLGRVALDRLAQLEQRVTPKTSAKLRKDLAQFAKLMDGAENATLDALMDRAAKLVPPTAKPRVDQIIEDAPRIRKRRQ